MLRWTKFLLLAAVAAGLFACGAAPAQAGPGWGGYHHPHHAGHFHVRPYANYRPHVHVNPYVYRPLPSGIHDGFHVRPYAPYRPHVHVNPYVHRPGYGW